MKKFFFNFFLLIIVSLFSLIIFLSFIGIETNKFDSLIKNKANNVSKYIKIGFKNTKIHLNPIELNLLVKLQNPKILIKNDEIVLSKLDLFLSLKSFFTSDFLLKRAEILFFENDIKDLTKISNIFVPKFINKRINKIFYKGNLEGEFIIPFNDDGSIGKDYVFSGKIFDATINLTKELSIKNLSTNITHTKDNEGIGLDIFINSGIMYDIKLANSIINIRRKSNEIKTKSSILTKGKVNSSQIQKIINLFNSNFNKLKDIDGVIDLKTDINFSLNKNLIVKNLIYSTDGKIDKLNIETIKNKSIKKYLPEYNSKFSFKEIYIKFNNFKSKRSLELNGFIKTKDYFDNFKLKQVYDNNEKTHDISGTIDLTNQNIRIPNLNYQKESGEKSELNFDTKFSTNSFYNIEKFDFSSNETKIKAFNLKFNKNFEINDFKKIEIKTFLNKNKNNDFLIEKSKKVVIYGSVFDAQPLLKSLYEKNEKSLFSKRFSSEVKVNFDKSLTGTDDEIKNFAMIANINKGSYDKLSLKGNFSADEIIEMSIYQVDKNKKTIVVISDRARPFIKNFNFIKGFEGGKLEYESIISKEITNSNLKLTNFKVSKVPALAQLLTLASLRGIADTLSGEGIRFESFEMKTNSKDNMLTIEDALAMGPAVSILMDGYVDKGKIVSLRGTLVPATKLNAIISSIPLVGKILVGKKTGEGVVGVSFKMKGPPKNIKTTVNPIKTLTPRFIVRAVENLKKKKKKEAK